MLAPVGASMIHPRPVMPNAVYDALNRPINFAFIRSSTE
jgi:hypothetical protein